MNIQPKQQREEHERPKNNHVDDIGVVQVQEGDVPDNRQHEWQREQSENGDGGESDQKTEKEIAVALAAKLGPRLRDGRAIARYTIDKDKGAARA